ncbi:MAG TPA: hypothetical protein VJX73_13210 [Terracidiphilus sp.]|nr:hypothetical protein [Terracidiphilus sp.]
MDIVVLGADSQGFMKPLLTCKPDAIAMSRKTNPLHPQATGNHPFPMGMLPASQGRGPDGSRSRSPNPNQLKGKTMKYVTMIARYLLGLMFLVFGSNMFLHFIPMGPMPAGLAGQFTADLFTSHYFYVVGAIMAVSGILFLVNVRALSELLRAIRLNEVDGDRAEQVG